MPRQSFTEASKCYVHDNVREPSEIKKVRPYCTDNLSLIEHTDGNHYCLFHLPTKHKDVGMFMKLFREKLDAIKHQVEEAEKLPEKERKKAKLKLSYDFPYFWFPMEVKLNSYKFEVPANFFATTFAEAVNFSGANFCKNAYFREATFHQDASFASATFVENAHFDIVEFNKDANFNSTKFLQEANFSLTIFSKGTTFKSTVFIQCANFESTRFLENSQTFFQQTKFCEKISFKNSIFTGYATFEGAKDNNVFLDETSVRNVKKELKEEIELRDEQQALLNLQNARLEKPERITFYRLRLRPSWFVNVDSRKMVFTDVRWDNLVGKSNNSNIIVELENLEKHKVSEPNRLLEITCRQMAVNAEENNRYKEASLFRRMAVELERLSRKEKVKAWRKEVGKVFSDETEYKNIFSAIAEMVKRLRTLLKYESYPFDFVHFLYRWLSGYGEKWLRAFCWLLVIWIVFAFLYTFFGTFGNEGRESIDFLRSIGYSLQVMTLQKPEPRPHSWIAYLLYGLETILAPVQAALLALAIRRKFMR